MSYAQDVTPDLALWVAGWLRELLADAPPPHQRNAAEWLIEQVEQAGLAPLDTSGDALGDAPVADAPVSDEPDAPPAEESAP